MKPGTVAVGWLHPGTVSQCFSASLLDLMFYDSAHNARIVSHSHGHIPKETGAGHLHAGRNEVARAFLDKSEAEWLFFIDSDMGFAPDTVDRLVASADPETRPVVGGLAFAQKSAGPGPIGARRFRANPTLYRAAEVDNRIGFVPMFDYPPDQLVEVQATGAACLLIHRTVLERVRSEYGDRWFSFIEVPKGEHGFTEFGEDMSFCLRLVAQDIPIWVDTGVKTTHDKHGVYLDEETYQLQQAMLEALR